MKQYQDERELAGTFLRMLQKLYILRNLDDIPANLTFKRLCERLVSNQSLAILNPDEQDLLRLFIHHEDIYGQILASGNPYVMEEALSRLNAYDRVIVQMLRLISDNRGSHPDGGYRILDEAEARLCRKQRSRKVLSWVLRSLNLSDHPVFTPIPTDPVLVEKTISKYKQALINVHPDYADVINNWEHDLDTVKLILNRRLNQIAVPDSIFNRLTPEGEDLYEFFYCLILRQSNRLADSYLEQYGPSRLEIAKQNFLWILNQKNILDDLENPPYAVSASQVIEQLYCADVRGLDQRSIDFLNERRENFALYNEIMSIPDIEEFAQAFNSMQPEDQAFISILQSIDKFYSEHGRNKPNVDSWYSPDFYEHLYLEHGDSEHKSQRFYSEESSETDNDEERDDFERSESYEAESQGEDESEDVFSDTPDNIDSKVEVTKEEPQQEVKLEENTQSVPVNDYEQGFLALLSHSSDELYDLAYNRTISILLKTGFIKDPVHPPKYKPQDLFYDLTNQKNLHLVEGEDVKFLIDRSLNTAIYLSIFRLEDHARQILIDSLQSQDRGFIMALLSLEDKSAPKDEVAKEAFEVNDSEPKTVILEPEEPQNIAPSFVPNPQSATVILEPEATPQNIEPEVKVEAAPQSVESEIKTETEPQRIEPEVKVEATPQSVEPEVKVETESQSIEPEVKVETESQSVEPEVKVEATPQSVEPEVKAEIEPQSVEPEVKVEATPQSVEPEVKAETEPQSIEPEVKVEATPQNIEPEVKAEIEPQSVEPEVKVEATPQSVETEATASVADESEPSVVIDPVTAAYERTAAILRGLDLCVDLDMGCDGSVCKDLQELFDKLYTLESFIVLEKPEQLFIYSRREHLPLFIEMQADDSKLSELEKLSADDQGFFKYLHSVNFGM